MLCKLVANTRVVSFHPHFGRWLIPLGCADKTSTGIFMAGDDEFGQVSANTPKAPVSCIIDPIILKLASIVVNKIACGWDHTVLTTETGQVWCGGDNSFAQCGLPPSTGQQASAFQPLEMGTHAVDAFAGFRHSAIIDSAHRIWLWGDNSRSQCGPRQQVAASSTLASSSDLTPAPTSSTRSLRTLKLASRTAPPAVLCLPAGACACSNTDCPTHVASAALGCRHSLALTACGRVISMGDNSWGQCGRGQCSRSEAPALVCTAPAPAPGEGSSPASAHHEFEKGRDGAAAAGAANASNTPLCPLSDVSWIGAGWHFGAAVAGRGGGAAVFTWGQNSMGQLGVDNRGELHERQALACAVQGAPHGEAVVLAAGSNHVLAGNLGAPRVYVWGWNEHGNLGLGHQRNACSPTAVELPGALQGVSAGGAISFLKTA